MRLRHALLAFLAVTVVAAFLVPGHRQAFALGKVQCPVVVGGYRQVDPIVAHGSPMSAHLHTFFGSDPRLTCST